jgi:hypothetical protein
MYFHFIDRPYIAVIGDIMASRIIGRRNDVQQKLQQVLETVNAEYAADIASNFTITLGDEFQGLLISGARVMDIVTDIERMMAPVGIRFGIGIGAITTDIQRDRAIGADGPGYYMARKAIDFLKSNEKRRQAATADIRLEVQGDHPETVSLINTVLSLMTAIKESWSDRQREVIFDMLKNRDNQTDAADRLGVRQPTIHKSLSRGYYYTYKGALDAVNEVLGEIRRDDA